jgi:predicted nuclease with TOPRIM domain
MKEGYIIAIIIAGLSWISWITLQLFEIRQNLKLLTRDTERYDPVQCAAHGDAFKLLEEEDNRLRDRIKKIEDKLEAIDFEEMMILVKDTSEYVHKIKTNGNGH